MALLAKNNENRKTKTKNQKKVHLMSSVTWRLLVALASIAA
jgi:hypothetical protein